MKYKTSDKSEKKVRINNHAEVSVFRTEIFENDEISFERSAESYDKDRGSMKKFERKHMPSPERFNYLSIVNENEVSQSQISMDIVASMV